MDPFSLNTLRDWSNRVARDPAEFNPNNPGHAYSAAQWDAIAESPARALGFQGHAIFTDRGHAQARQLAGDRPVLAYITVLHTYRPEYYSSGAWPWVTAQGELMAGTELLNVEGAPSIRWRAKDSRWDAFNTDPSQVSAEAWAAMVAEWATQLHPVDGLFLDYLSEQPWTYPDEPDPEVRDGGALWQAWQIMALHNLRMFAPHLLLVANGRWALEAPGLTHGGLFDCVYLEKMGGLWYSPTEALAKLADHRGPVTRLPGYGSEGIREKWRGHHLLDVTPFGQSRTWPLDQMAAAVSAAVGWAVDRPVQDVE